MEDKYYTFLIKLSTLKLISFLIFSLFFNNLIVKAQKLYGLGSTGGSSGLGAIIEYDIKAQKITSPAPFSFSTSFEGRNPNNSKLVEFNGELYGMTVSGGAYDKGIIFKWDPESNAYTKIFDFDGLNGEFPKGSLILIDDKFYGTTSSGGVNSDGVIFEFDPIVKVYSKKVDLIYENGSNPLGSLTYYNGKFYGLARSGGEAKGGVIFEWNPENNIYTAKIHLNLDIGVQPKGDLVLVNDKFYGFTFLGGEYDQGVIFEWIPTSNEYIKLFDFDYISHKVRNPNGSLVAFQNVLFGIFSGGESGLIFKWDLTNSTFEKVIEFEEDIHGYFPNNTLLRSGDKLYGVTRFNNGSRFFEFDPVTYGFKSLEELDGYAEISGSITRFDGKFYGLSISGGLNDDGYIFGWDSETNNYLKKVDFAFNQLGSDPLGSLVQYENKLYGMTSYGGEKGGGVIFEWDPVTKVFENKVSLEQSIGYQPYGNLTLYKDKFYGMTCYGGAYNYGAIFEWDPHSNLYTVKVDFEYDTNGAYPQGSLFLYEDKFYGKTIGGGEYEQGVIFEWNPEDNYFVKRLDFNLVNGGGSKGSFVEFNGKLYSTTKYGGQFDGGSIYEWDPFENIYTIKYSFSSIDGIIPSGTLTLHNKKLYGLTSYGGEKNHGVIFEWDPSNGEYRKIKDIDGTISQGYLFSYKDLLYGMSYSKGTIFNINPNTNEFNILGELDESTGSWPMYGSLINFAVPDTESPTQPSIGLESKSETSITLKWTESTDDVGVVGYDVYQGETLIKNTTELSYRIENLSPCTEYTFIIIAKDEAENEAPSEVFTVSTTDETVALIPELATIKVQCAITLTPPTTTDNCSGEILGFTDDLLTYNQKGTYTIEWEFDDGNGNVVTASQQVVIEEGISAWYADKDGDGYGDPAVSLEACEQPEGYVADDRDCDDNDIEINPEKVWYADTDGDGYGNSEVIIESCEQPEGYVADYTDCDDSNKNSYPGAPELCDGLDNDCDGYIEVQTSFSLNVNLSIPESPSTIKLRAYIYQSLETGLDLVKEEILSTNSFNLTDLPEGNYLIKIVPNIDLHPNLLTTYSGNTVLESEAELVYLSSDSNYETQIQEIVNDETGNGTIEGVVLSQTGISGGRITQGLEETGTPLPNIPVYAESASTGKIESNAVSNESGWFKLEGLKTGNYQIKADYQGKAIELNSSTVELEKENTIIQLSILVSDEEISMIVESVTGISDALLAKRIRLFPNPIKTKMTIETNTPVNSIVQIRIIDASGKEILQKNFAGNSSRFELNIGNFSRGIYLIDFSSKEGKAIWKVVKQ